ncbi:hypothetical protein E3P99_00357 [Wallemia hederae]|uniref:Nudix hydrolase domain-containing protein n=1 Tax=Wallemia hederae TaxID=1540922 RepID=A0A4T0FWV6_9BASI|nr:hypothetical protein E3P99_00357 [Wallemia hederae]
MLPAPVAEDDAEESYEQITAHNTYTPCTTTTIMINVGVGCFVLNHRDQILVGKRLNSIGHAPAALPGGHLEFGESFEQCAAREVEEETGLNPDILSEWKFGTAVSAVTEEQHYVTIFMIAKQATDTELMPITSEPEKCEGWSWVEWEDLKSIAPNRLFKPLSVLIKDRSTFRPTFRPSVE